MGKRVLSGLLILCMIWSLCPAGALAAGESAQAEAAEAAGELRVLLHRSGALAETDFDLRLTDRDGQLSQREQIRANRGEDVCAFFLSGIPDGRYTLSLTAPGYLPYVQELDFDGRCVGLTLYNYASVNDGRSEADGLFGVFPAGDVNGDGSLDDADADAVVSAMDSRDEALDLDGSGQVDLADLAICVRNAGTVQPALPVHSVSSQVLTGAVAPVSTVGAVSGSSLSELLDQQKADTVATLTPANDAPISETNPVEIALPTSLAITAPDGSEEAARQAAAAPVQAEAIYIEAPNGTHSTIAAGAVTVEGVDMEGRSVTLEAPIAQAAAPAALLAAGPEVTVERDGSIVIDLGTRVAIKKVTIRVTAAADQGSLAQIAKVEFLSDFAERIPEPQLSIPKVLSVSNTESDGLGYKNLTVTWTPQPNVTGYELSVTGPGYSKTATSTAATYTLLGDSFNGTVKSFETYQIRVRSVSGDWRSDWSESYAHTVTCAKKPPAPEYLAVTPAAQSLQVSWSCKYDAQWYTLYYKEAAADSYTAVEDITAQSCVIPNLKGGVRYTVYVVAHNKNGDSPSSQTAQGVPLTPTGVEMPKYKLLNVEDGQGAAMTHVTAVGGNGRGADRLHFYGGEDWSVLMDNDPGTYLEISDWDNGAAYDGAGGNSDSFRGPEIKLDGAYTFDTVRFSPFEGETVSQYDATLAYYDESGELVRVSTTLSAKTDALGRRYYEAVAQRPITADNLQLRTRTFNTAPITMAEVRVYTYDDLEDQVADLFADEMCTTLRGTVTKAQVDALVERVNTVDEESGEYHPHRETILDDLNYALELLADSSKLAEILEVDNTVTANGSPQNGFAQTLSDYQPLGCVAGAGDTVVIYVSDLDDKTPRGSGVNLNLIATQYHAQVSAWQSSVVRLKAGRNEVVIPRIGSDATERGGSLYLQYTGTRGGNRYAVRVSGADAIPTLRLDGVAEDQRPAAIREYTARLQSYAAGVEALHGRLHEGGFDKRSCFLNATEITMENMMYSLPATELWQALSSYDDPAEQLERAIAAMEQEIDYFYAFKGLNKQAEDRDAYPYTRLNIRYHQMFTGAFMYAGGKHIGIEFDSAAELMGLSPIVADDRGRYVGGKLTGWGIAHEIGHCINDASYQRVEVTNNVFAQLAKAGGADTETNENFRTTYDKVYDAVASGTTGHTGDLAVQLAMYWQLHLAYDNDYAFRTYDSIQAQQEGLFYARLESYLRDRSKAQPALPATSSGDQLFMQAACAAAGRDILDFFTAWGFAPDAVTRSYAAGFEKEERKIQYIDDDSRLYRLENGAGMSGGTAVTAAIENAVDRRVDGNRVEIRLGDTNVNEDAMLGYEISRNGRMVAFVPAGETHYTDVITTANNQAMRYTVVGIDRLLGETEPLELGEVKVCHDGAIDKSGWTAQTNMTSPRDAAVEKDENDPESGAVTGNSTTPAPQVISAIGAALDNDPATVYCGRGNGRPTVTLDLNGVEQVAALKFTPAPRDYSGDAGEGLAAAADLYKYRLFGYRVEVSLDGETWETVKEGEAYTGSAANPNSWKEQSDVVYNADGSYTLYFSRKNADGSLEPCLYTYDAAYVRLTATNMSMLAVAELDVLGPTGDNVELIETGFGKLESAYTAGTYADGSDCVIPAGSVVFYGSYRGDPSYNVVLLTDQDGEVLDGSQLIFAPLPSQGALGETSDGRWFFWLEDAEKTDDLGETYNEFDQLESLTRIQARLYRVQDAQTLAGQRLTSTSLTMTLPADVPGLTITGGEIRGVAYAPTEAMIRLAQSAQAPAGSDGGEELPGGAGVYADTGAAETEEPSPVILTAGKGRADYAAAPDSLGVAAQVEFSIDPASGGAKVQPGAKDGLYQAARYDAETGLAGLYCVARRGNFGGSRLTGSITGLSAGATVGVKALTEVDGLYAVRETALSAAVQTQTSGSDSDSGSGSGSSSRPGGGSGGGSGSGAGGGDPVQPQSVFSDVVKGSWYEEAVNFVYEAGMMEGTSEGVFSPELTTSRAMVVTILWRLEGSPVFAAPDGAETPSRDYYTDVAEGRWYTEAVRWASEKGVVNGMGDGTFAPDAPVTREQLAAILYRYAAGKGYAVDAAGTLGSFVDAERISAYAVEAMAWANGAGLITGMGGDVLAPRDNATRAQTAAILYRFCSAVAQTA